MPHHFILNFISSFIKTHKLTVKNFLLPHFQVLLTKRRTHLIMLVVSISKENAYLAIFSTLIIIYWILLIKGKDIALTSPYPHYCSPIFLTWLYHKFCFKQCSCLCYISKFHYDYVRYCSLSYMAAADDYYFFSFV